MPRIATILLACLLVLASSSCASKRHVARGNEQQTEQVRDKGKKSADPRTRLVNEAYTWLGTPYRYGGNTKAGVDCSGLVVAVYNKILGIKLPRSSREQSEFCNKIKKSELRQGDLLFFNTSKGKKVSHVGLYVGDGRMIHASTRGVVINGIEEDYYRRHFLHAARVPQLKK